MNGVMKFLIISVLFAGVVYLALAAMLYFSQRSYIYYPVGRSPGAAAFTLDRGEAQVVVSTRELEGPQAVLYFGGNAEDVAGSLPSLALTFPQASLYAMHYRGYGGSSGAPSERAIVGDAQALYDLVASAHPEVTVVGRSLGSGVAVQVAAARRIDRVVLVTPFQSLSGIAAAQFPWFPVRWLLKDPYDSGRVAAKVTAPTTLIVAADDELIPGESSRALAEAFPAGTEVNVVTLEGAGHNFGSDDPRYLAALAGRSAARSVISDLAGVR